MKSQNSSLQLGAQEGDEYSGSLCLDFGFKPLDVMTAAELLDDAEVKQVEDSGFSTFLNLQLGTICERKETNLCMKIVDLEENRIKVQLQKDVIGYITPEEIYHLLRLPRGDKAPLKYNKQQQKDFAKLRTELGDPKMSLEIADILALMRREDKKHLKGYIVDNLKLTEIEDKNYPRINQYTMETLMSTIGNAKCHHGRISFDNFKLKALEETCYVESSRLYIQSPVDSQHLVSAVVTSGVPPETQMPMPMRLLHQAHGFLSAVQPVARSIGIDPEALDECIAGLALQRAHGLLSAVQPLAPTIGIDLEELGACIAGIAQYGAVNRGLARSDAGAVNMREEETSCSFSDGVIGKSHN